MTLHHLDYQSPELGYPWIAKVPRAHWNAVFDLAAEVLRYIGTQKEDEKLALTFRYDSDKKRFAVIIGRKYISGFYLDKEDTLLRFYIDPAFDIKSEPAIEGSDFEFADQTQLVYCRVEEYAQLSEEFKKRSLDASREYAVAAPKSPYKRNHRPWIWEVIFNPEAREEFLAYVESSPEERIKTIYRAFLREEKNQEEIYKWELLENFQKVWDLEADDFGEVLKNVKFKNLLSGQAISFLGLMRNHPEESREYLKYCMNESIPVDERIAGCKERSAQLLQKWHPKWNRSGQDELTLSVFWFFNHPEKHFPYKDSFYGKWCSFMNVHAKKAGQKYSHYQKLCNDFLAKHVVPDDELVQKHQSTLPTHLAQLDPAHHLLVQNMLYVVFDQIWKEEKIEYEEEENQRAKTKSNAEKNDIMTSKKPPLNQILYGPPGTGKTYHTIDRAVALIDGTNNDHKANKPRFDALVDEGRIRFVTFHQSMTYEDFIEGIKPIPPDGDNSSINYDIEDGIFKRICSAARSAKISGNNFEKSYKSLLKEIKAHGGGLVLETLVRSKEFTVYENSKGNLKFHANTEIAHEAVIRKDFIEHYLLTGETKDWPSYLKAVAKHMVENHDYQETKKETSKKFVLIIDEINRGNVAEIFGELITLIEADKREGMLNALSVQLPYSKKEAPFSVPPNLYIIGTMNTADRSVEALDSALRRRFTFKEMMPNHKLIEDELGSNKDWNGISVSEVLKTINERIEVLVDRDHTIGHSYFLVLKNTDPDQFETAFKRVFTDSIIPLLQEYFYHDYIKIGMVLGKGFVKLNDKEISFASFDESLADDYGNGGRVELLPPDEIELEKALKLLLNEKKPESKDAES